MSDFVNKREEKKYLDGLEEITKKFGSSSVGEVVGTVGVVKGEFDSPEQEEDYEQDFRPNVAG